MTDSELSTRSLDCAALALLQGVRLLRCEAIDPTSVEWFFENTEIAHRIFTAFKNREGIAGDILQYSAARRQVLAESKRALAEFLKGSRR